MKFHHNLDGLTKLVNLINKIEEEFGDSPKLFCESTGIYHLTLLHFLRKNQKDISVINPLISNSNRNFNIRKVKNDKRDSLSLAKLGKFDNVKTSMDIPEDFLHLKFLVREYYNRIDDRANVKKEFSNSLNVYYPGLKKAFSNICSKTALAFFENYPTPQSFIDAVQDDVIHLLRTTAKCGLEWSNKKYLELLQIANEALF
ncbi:transposase [Clostridium sp. 'deep sea']|uniref:IS110 family transposase n=1 Tax=Clostridium sp. 'deep sea' TaxID=2779445 RepID=UPI001896A4F6|nr:transposase [Clostridium sp. 'deep sea']QOR34363.1 transposase [Clostridium sp. 'deep sea']